MSRTKNFQIEKKWVFLDEEETAFTSNDLSPEIVSILSNRGIKSEEEALEFLNPKYESLSDPFMLEDMDLAVRVILDSIKNHEKITIYGDYDVDGITGTALLCRFFKLIGVEVEYYIPSRQDEGYGLNKTAIKELAKNGTKLIITVDCGSTSLDEIEVAKELGIKVVVTDRSKSY